MSNSILIRGTQKDLNNFSEDNGIEDMIEGSEQFDENDVIYSVPRNRDMVKLLEDGVTMKKYNLEYTD